VGISTSQGAVTYNSGTKGPLKAIESGPSKAEWYDSSTFWASMFRGFNPRGHGTGIIQAIQEECCLMARRIYVRLPFCTIPKNTDNFIIGRTSKR
jgi:hypothetical protein